MQNAPKTSAVAGSAALSLSRTSVFPAEGSGKAQKSVEIRPLDVRNEEITLRLRLTFH